MKAEQPNFRFLTFATGVFYFQRLRAFGDYCLREMLHITYSFTDHTMQASVSSRLNPVHALSPIYNDGLINPHVDLFALKSGRDIFPASETCYRCDGSLEGAREMVSIVISDFQTAGIGYLDKRFDDLQSSRLILTGIDIIKSWDHDRTMLGNELQLQLRRAKFRFSRVKQPLLNELRSQLESVPDQQSDARQEIHRLAFDLMELYCNRRIAAY
jgi:hypothetical protein